MFKIYFGKRPIRVASIEFRSGGRQFYIDEGSVIFYARLPDHEMLWDKTVHMMHKLDFYEFCKN